MQWVSTGYLLALIMVVPLTAWSVQRFGARRMWLSCLALFLLGSVLSGAAWSIGSLIAFRVLQGLGGGMLLPLIRTILAESAGKERLGRAMAFVVTPGSLAPILGPVLGGLVIGSLNWRWAFFINVPICLLGLVLAWRTVPADPPRGDVAPLDVLGLALLSVGLGALLYGISDLAPLPGLLGVALLGAYVVHALRTTTTPILDLRLFRVRSFTAASWLVFLLGISLFGVTLLIPLYYQQAGGYTVLEAGLLLAPRAIGSGLAFFFVGKLVDRTGAERALTLAGMALAIAGTLPFALATERPHPALFAVALFAMGLGIGAVLITTMTATYRGLTPEQFAPATSASRIMQQLGGSVGTVVLAVFLQHATASHGVGTAFGHTFTLALALTALAIGPALLLGPKPTHVPLDAKTG